MNQKTARLIKRFNQALLVTGEGLTSLESARFLNAWKRVWNTMNHKNRGVFRKTMLRKIATG